MLRNYIANEIVTDATYKAHAAMKTGYAVVKDADKVTAFPSAATGDELWFVNKARVPSGVNAARSEFSDFDANFNDVAQNEMIVLTKYKPGQIFGTDGTDALAAGDVGKVLVSGVDGKLELAANTTTSPYKYLGAYTDNGHTLAKIEVLDTPITN